MEKIKLDEVTLRQMEDRELITEKKKPAELAFADLRGKLMNAYRERSKAKQAEALAHQQANLAKDTARADSKRPRHDPPVSPEE